MNTTSKGNYQVRTHYTTTLIVHTMYTPVPMALHKRPHRSECSLIMHVTCITLKANAFSWEPVRLEYPRELGVCTADSGSA